MVQLTELFLKMEAASFPET